jgi:hypothetical protein
LFHISELARILAAMRDKNDQAFVEARLRTQAQSPGAMVHQPNYGFVPARTLKSCAKEELHQAHRANPFPAKGAVYIPNPRVAGPYRHSLMTK